MVQYIGSDNSFRNYDYIVQFIDVGMKTPSKIHKPTTPPDRILEENVDLEVGTAKLSDITKKFDMPRGTRTGNTWRDNILHHVSGVRTSR
jgi:hypothetical protein